MQVPQTTERLQADRIRTEGTCCAWQAVGALNKCLLPLQFNPSFVSDTRCSHRCPHRRSPNRLRQPRRADAGGQAAGRLVPHSGGMTARPHI